MRREISLKIHLHFSSGTFHEELLKFVESSATGPQNFRCQTSGSINTKNTYTRLFKTVGTWYRGFSFFPFDYVFDSLSHCLDCHELLLEHKEYAGPSVTDSSSYNIEGDVRRCFLIFCGHSCIFKYNNMNYDTSTSCHFPSVATKLASSLFDFFKMDFDVDIAIMFPG